jgi:hypothetical protein
MPKIPKYGDKEMLSTDPTVRPSHERMPFGPSGVLKPEGPGPYPEGFLTANDVLKLPWKRRRGEEWTDEPFRTAVLKWVKEFLQIRTGISRWDIQERACPTTWGLVRLPDDDHYLVFGMTRRRDSHRFEISVPFPVAERTGVALLSRLDHARVFFDSIIW